MKPRRTAGLALLLALASGIVCAQNGPDNDPASLSGSTTEPFATAVPDSINEFNGQLAIPIAVGPSYPIGPNLRFQVMLTYNSRVWELGHPSTQNGAYTYTPITGNPALGIGWNLSLGAIKICAGTSTHCYVGPDGGQHIFDEADAKRGTGFYKSSDGSRLSLKVNGTPDTCTTSCTGSGFEMWDEAENHYVFDTTSSASGGHVYGYDDSPTNFTRDFGRGRNGWYLTKLEDPFHNTYTVTYYSNNPTSHSPCAPNVWTYQGSPHPEGVMACPSSATASLTWIPSKITVPKGSGTMQDILVDLDGTTHMITGFEFPVSSGATATWTLSYGTPQCYLNDSSGTINLSTISAINFPLGLGGTPKYSFSYYLDKADGTCAFPKSCAPSGLLKQITLPTLGTISYRYRFYEFYHTRKVRFAPGCTAVLIPAGQFVTGSDVADCGTQNPNGPGGQAESPNPSLPGGGTCDTSDVEAFLDTFSLGVAKRTLTTGSVVGTTDYYQYTFPYGEYGTGPSPSNCDRLTPARCGAESMTIVVNPEVDLNGGVAGSGRRSSRAILFSVDSTGTAGATEGAPLEERVFDFDAHITEPGAQPPPPSITTACGNTNPANDQPFCSTNAVRTIRRIFEYGDEVNGSSSRRLMSETTFYQATAADGTCAACASHVMTFSNLSGRVWDNAGSSGNGRHYNVETHSGSLGNDTRTITTTWAPQITSTSYLPDLLTERKDVLGSSTRDQFFEFDTTTGFPKGTFIWDVANKPAWLNCKYKDAAGNVASELTATFNVASLPANTYCADHFGTMPSVGGDQDMFGQSYTYQNGEIKSATWLAGTVPIGPLNFPWSRFTLTRDASTGWVTAAADSSTASTSDVYDAIGRPITVTPPGEAAVSITYPSTTQTVAQRSGGTGLVTYEESDFDGAGRLAQQKRLMTGGQYANRYFTYDGRGNQIFASEWTSSAVPPPFTFDLTTTCIFPGSPSNLPTKRPSAAPGTYLLCFDPFGRPQQSVGSDFSSLTTVDRTNGSSYYSDTKEAATTACVGGTLLTSGSCGTGGANATATSVRDAFGRTVSVTEPDLETTTYAYDVNSNLTSVSLGATSPQIRTFSYNPFGFLLSETTPERGTVTYTSYGSLGNLRLMAEADGLKTLRCYEAAGRVTSIRSSEGLQVGQDPTCGLLGLGRLYAGFVYDLSPPTQTVNPLGKVSQRLGWNWPFGQEAMVTENFTYGGVGNRLSQRTIAAGTGVAATPSNAGENLVSEAQTWTYNTLGLVTTRRHASGNSELVTTFDAGLPTQGSLAGQPVFSSVGYNPAGGISSWTAGNTVVTTIAQDSSLLPRPSSISTSGASTNFASGTYGYDGVGNILSIGTGDTFAYDSLSRLKTASYSSLGNQYFCYDRYGNRVSKSTTSSSCSGTVWSDNRVPGLTYDARGNLIVNGAESMFYDGMNRQVRDIASGVEWDYLYDGGGERLAKIPASLPVLRREMARYIVEARGEQQSGSACVGGHSAHFADVPCTDPDAHWIDKFSEDGITAGCGGGNYCLGSTTTREQMAAFFIVALGHQAIPQNQCSSPTRFTDVPCTDGFWGSVEEFAILGLTAGCGGGNFCPTGTVPENQMLAFMQPANAWPTYFPVARGTVYTLRDEAGRVSTEKVSSPGGDGSNPPSPPNTYGRDNAFLGNLLVASDVTSTLSGTLGFNYYHADHLGSPRLVTNSSHAAIESWKYWPYGDEAVTSPTSQRLRFAGMERDIETSHYYDHARNEDFNLGRFLRPDPLEITSTGPQTWNRYGYVLGNPATLIDPQGLVVIGPGDPAAAFSFLAQLFFTGSVTVNGSDPGPIPWFALTPDLPSAGTGSIGSSGSDSGALAFARDFVEVFSWKAVGRSFTDPEGCNRLMAETIARDTFPFPTESTLTPTVSDAIEPSTRYAAGWYYNASVGYAAAQGLSYPLKSSIFRGLWSTADVIETGAAPLLASYAIAHGVFNAVRAASNGQCR